MKQPKIHIKDTNGADYGIKPIATMYWNTGGQLWCIQVDFMGEQRDLLVMYNNDGKGEFKNQHGNLIGKIIL